MASSVVTVIGLKWITPSAEIPRSHNGHPAAMLEHSTVLHRRPLRTQPRQAEQSRRSTLDVRSDSCRVVNNIIRYISLIIIIITIIIIISIVSIIIIILTAHAQGYTAASRWKQSGSKHFSSGTLGVCRFRQAPDIPRVCH